MQAETLITLILRRSTELLSVIFDMRLKVIRRHRIFVSYIHSIRFQGYADFPYKVATFHH